MPYADVDTVKLIACIEAAQLNKTDEQFDSMLAKLITWTTGEINSYLNRSYTDDELAADADLKAAIESVTVQAVDNFLLATYQRKITPIVTVNDFAVKNPPRIILTDDMKDTLGGYQSFPGVGYTAGAERFTNTKTGLMPEDEVS